MPVMDGLEAMTAIRLAEQTRGGRIPIIALTAHAMKGDRETCLAAGADGYLSKPLNTSALFEQIESLTGTVPAHPTVAADNTPPGQVFDLDELLERVEGDRALLTELVRLFQEETPRLLELVRTSARNLDFAELERAAHGLKGACANLGARPAARAALAIELSARQSMGDDLDALVAQLETETRNLDRALHAVVGDGAG
jgi:CheY-like chemotaxis protein